MTLATKIGLTGTTGMCLFIQSVCERAVTSVAAINLRHPLIIVMSPLRLCVLGNANADPCSPRCHQQKPLLYIKTDEMGLFFLGGGGGKDVKPGQRKHGSTVP